MAPEFDGLVNNLTTTTDQFITGSLTVSTSAQSSSQGAKPRIAPVPLVWSVALRVSQNIIIQASIEYVVCLLTLVSFIQLVLRVGRSREYIDVTLSPFRQIIFR